MKLKSLTIILGTALLWSCSSESIIKNPKAGEESLQFRAQVGEYFTPSRAIGTTWTPGDEIGVYAVKAGESISQDNYNEDLYNLFYTTEKGDGNFTRMLFPIKLDGKNPVDIIAYYPYNNSIGSNPVYLVDVADQSNPEAIDLLYSNNVKNIKDNGTENLVFAHKMSQFFFRIQKGEGVETLEGLSVKSFSGLVSEGSMDLNSGNMALGEAKNEIINLPIAEEEGVKVISAVLVPNQSLSTAKLVISLDGKNYTWDGFDKALESGKKYTFKAKLSKNKKIDLEIDGAIIESWISGHEDEDVTNLDPDEPTVIDGKFELNVTSFDITADGSNGEKLIITADENVEWNLSTESDWISFESSQGKGSASVTVSVAVNELNEVRTGVIKVTANGKTIEVVVKQEAKKQITGDVTLLEDNFNVTNTIQLDAYTGMIADKLTEMPGFSYEKKADSKTKIEVRSAKGGNIWLPGNKAGALALNNIPTRDFSEIKLIMQLSANADNLVKLDDLVFTIGESVIGGIPSTKLSKTAQEVEIIISNQYFKANENIIVSIGIDNLADGVAIENLVIKGIN